MHCCDCALLLSYCIIVGLYTIAIEEIIDFTAACLKNHDKNHCNMVLADMNIFHMNREKQQGPLCLQVCVGRGEREEQESLLSYFEKTM